jgi:hypothetical protein
MDSVELRRLPPAHATRVPPPRAASPYCLLVGIRGTTARVCRGPQDGRVLGSITAPLEAVTPRFCAASGYCKPSRTPAVDELAVTCERTQVVFIRSQADVAVGAHRQQCSALDAEESSSGEFEPPDLI